LLWAWIGLMNPHRLGWGFAYSLPFAMIAVALLVVGMMTHPKQVRAPTSGPVTVLALFVAWMGITTLTAIHQPALDLPRRHQGADDGAGGGLDHADANRLPRLGVTAMSIAYFGAKGGLFTLMTGGSFRVWGRRRAWWRATMSSPSPS
jgi:hypothetical protein